MKKTIFTLLSLTLATCLVACSDKSQNTDADISTLESNTLESSTLESVEMATTQQEAEDYGTADMPLGISMTVTETDGATAIVVIDNHSGYEMTYGNEYGLEKLEEGEWIELPITADIAFTDVANIIADLEQQTVTYDLTIFGNEEGSDDYKLQAGTYKLSVGDWSAEFEVE